jgi:hypothetical protein
MSDYLYCDLQAVVTFVRIHTIVSMLNASTEMPESGGRSAFQFFIAGAERGLSASAVIVCGVSVSDNGSLT